MPRQEAWERLEKASRHISVAWDSKCTQWLITLGLDVNRNANKAFIVLQQWACWLDNRILPVLISRVSFLLVTHSHASQRYKIAMSHCVSLQNHYIRCDHNQGGVSPGKGTCRICAREFLSEGKSMTIFPCRNLPLPPPKISPRRAGGAFVPLTTAHIESPLDVFEDDSLPSEFGLGVCWGV